MRHQVELSDAEVTMVLELLDNERRALPPEIHHTDDRDMRDDLRQRRVMVDQLIDRLRHQTVPTP